MTTNSKPKGKRLEKKPQQATPTVQNAPKVPARSSTLSMQGIDLNSETARQAIILSEIIGPPAAKRRRRR